MNSVLRVTIGLIICGWTFAEVVETSVVSPGDTRCERAVFFSWLDLVYRKDYSRNEVYCWRAGSAVESIWRTENIILEVKDNGKGLVAFRESECYPNHHRHDFLHIITEQGKLVATLREVASIQEFCWSPAGDKVAFTLGQNIEGSGYLSQGLHIYCLDTGEIEQVNETGWFVHWAKFDGRIYYWSEKNNVRGVYAYDVKEDEETISNLHGTMFSHDETYYYVYVEEDIPEAIKLYDRATNVLVAERSESPVSLVALMRMAPLKWLDDKHLLMFVRDSEFRPRDHILDVGTGRIRARDGWIVSGCASGIVLIQKSDGSLEPRAISTMEQFNPLDLPKSWIELQ